MNKIKLNVDMLAVESFDTQAAIHGTGTVRANQDSVMLDCTYAPDGCVYTANRLDKQCYDSLHYCAETNLRPCSTTESGNTDC